jgi:hypothetical protein
MNGRIAYRGFQEPWNRRLAGGVELLGATTLLTPADGAGDGPEPVVDAPLLAFFAASSEAFFFAPVPTHALRHHAHHSLGVGSGVATCPEAPSPSLGRRRLRSRHMPHGSRPAPCVGRLWRRHVTEAPGPPPGRAPVPARVLWLQTLLLVREGFGAVTCSVALGPRAYRCVPKTPDIRPIMAPLGTRCRQRIKCVCDRPYAAYDRH